MDLKDVLGRLTEPIPENEINWKPQRIQGSEAQMVAFLDARFVAERLDEAAEGQWEFHWDVAESNVESVAVRGTLTVCGLTRQDAGEYQRRGENDDMEAMKAAVSDALKRCAVMFGLGRELYRMGATWVRWDGQSRRPADGEMDRVRAELRKARAHWTNDPEQAAAFTKWVTEKNALTKEDALKALGVSQLAQFKGTKKAAQDAIESYASAKAGKS